MNSQKIALFGTPGDTSQRLATEALKRGHNVTAIVPDKKTLNIQHPNLKVVQGDVRRKEDVSKYAEGHDVVICSHEPTQTKPREHVEITRSVIEGAKTAGVNHVLSIAHPFNQPAERTEEAYNEFKPIVKVQQEALKLFQNEPQLQWGYVHSIEPEAIEGTRKYRTSDEVFYTNQEGRSILPIKEYTSLILDEAEKGEMEFHNEEDEEEF